MGVPTYAQVPAFSGHWEVIRHSETPAAVDLEMRFLRAEGIPTTDVVSPFGVYFEADLDGRLSYASKVAFGSAAPTWDESWQVRNVPSTSKLHVQVLLARANADTVVCDFTLDTYGRTGKEPVVVLNAQKQQISVWIQILATPSKPIRFSDCLFDGPIRYHNYFSRVADFFSSLDPEARTYSVWKVYLRHVDRYFDSRDAHPWNRKIKHTRKLAESIHKTLYSGQHLRDQGSLSSTALLSKIRPATYTYVLCASDNTFRFSETSSSFFTDKLSKHAVHSGGAMSVHYAGEFHLRPKGGWANFRPEQKVDARYWEVVLDNSSGTYEPAFDRMTQMQQLLKDNFPELTICVRDFKQSAQDLQESKNYCNSYGKSSWCRS